ncbi:MAG: type II toxin-antitoxin system HipA family toxin [Acidimicrobiales bacterium]|nr:type II toxin-antitoxin system HipA family toxin [Acidimicrobiales bacterium]
MSFAGVDVVEVWAWGELVGAVALDPATDAYAFEYTPDWIARGIDLSPLHLPARPGVAVFPELNPATFLRLPPMLADALPDRFGNALIDAWMARHGIPADRVTPLDRLAYTADRAMGALEFRPPAGAPTPEPTAIALADLVTTARAALAGELTEGPAAEEALSQLIAVGTSAGGARAKAVIAYRPETGQIRSGQLGAPEGFEQWLIKLDGVTGDPTWEASLGEGTSYGIVEYAYHLMARAAGIDMAECRLLPEGPRTHFLTRRFDRTGTDGKIHLQSLCGLAHLDFNLPGAHDYAQYLQTIDALGLGAPAREQAFRRIAFNVAAVNRDDHTKNLAFLCDPDGTWRLAPAFDVTFAHNPAGRWTSVHQMAVEGKRDGIALADLEALADRGTVPGYRDVIAEVLAAVDRWPELADQAGVPAETAEAIAEEHRRHRPR